MTTANRTLLTLKRSASGEHSLLEERLHKVLANAGLGSRRLLETRIKAGEIKVNGQAAELGSNVRAGDRVELDNKLFVAIQDNAEHAQVLVYHKPEGMLTTRNDPEGRPTIFEQLPRLKGARWIAVGRLDTNTTGLLLLTTDGALAHALMHPSSEVAREYICRVHGEVPDEALEKLRSGVQLDDGLAHFDELAIISRGDSHSWFRLVLSEGRNREVRRMWESQGLLVSRLKRIRYGNIELPRGLRKGQSETLGDDLVKGLRGLCGANEPTPVLTLQAVIGQRRAKPGNEFRPEPRTQQAWTGGYQEEGRELRAFDRIREEAPLRRSGKDQRPGSGFKKNPHRKPNAGPNRPRPPYRDNNSASSPWSANDRPRPNTRKPPHERNGNTFEANEGRPLRGKPYRPAHAGQTSQGGAFFRDNTTARPSHRPRHERSQYSANAPSDPTASQRPPRFKGPPRPMRQADGNSYPPTFRKDRRPPSPDRRPHHARDQANSPTGARDKERSARFPSPHRANRHSHSSHSSSQQPAHNSGNKPQRPYRNDRPRGPRDRNEEPSE